MALYTLLILLLTTTSTLAQSCTTVNARAIDADVAFLAYWEIIEVSWGAIAAIKKRSPFPRNIPSIFKRDLECTSSEECLSFKTVPFCYDKSTYTFHTADGTTGNFLTGEYELADGRVGNMYKGPYPTNTKAVTQSQQPATATVSLGGGIASTPTGSQGITPTVSSQQGMGISKTATPAGSTAAKQMPSSTTVLVLKSGGSWMEMTSWSVICGSAVVILVSSLLYV